MTSVSQAAGERRRLRWQCRRGMLELDLILNRFIDIGYDSMPGAEKVRFARLLEHPDQMLYDWIMGHTVPTDSRIHALIKRIQTVGGYWDPRV